MVEFNTDRPIVDKKDDILGRGDFSEQLGRAIHQYTGKDSLVIGLYGKWGSGKTSIANMALKTIEELSADSQHKSIIMRFSPWNYSDSCNLISQFFSCLRIIVSNDTSELKTKVGSALEEYSEFFDYVSYIPGAGMAGPVLKKISKTCGRYLSKQSTDLDTCKKKLEKSLYETDRKIIVLIDDIDRLNNTQIKDIFQLVKQVGDLPNIIYLLVMDRDIVRKALIGVHDNDGNEYLEKIVQVPFVIPELQKHLLHDFFFSKLNSILNEVPRDVRWSKQYWDRVFNYCIAPYLHTLRDVNRVINTFQFRFSSLCEDIAFEDVIGLTTIEVLKPDLFKWIADNKDAVCGSFIHSLESNQKKKGEYRKAYSLAFEKMGLDAYESIRSIAVLFPVFAKDVDEHFDETTIFSNIRGQMRVAHENRYDTFFSFNLDNIKISRSVINECINSLNLSELKDELLKINNKGDIVYFLEELQALVNEVPIDRVATLVTALLEIQMILDGETHRAFFTVSASYLASFCIEELLKRASSDNERFEIISSALQKSSKDSLGAFADVINTIELAYGRWAEEGEKKEGQLVSIEQLEKLEKKYMDQVHVIDSKDDLLKVRGFLYMFCLWEKLAEADTRRYIDNIKKDNIKILKFICNMAARWDGTSSVGWSFNPDYYSQFITDQEIIDCIEKLDKDKLNHFSELELIKLASFVLNRNCNGPDADEKQALELVVKWKHQIENGKEILVNQD